MATRVNPPGGACAEGKHYYSIWRNTFELDTEYIPIKPIGRGAYGVVCSAKNEETNEKVAIKKIINAFENQTDARRTLREIKLLRLFNHDKIITLKDIMTPVSRTNFHHSFKNRNRTWNRSRVNSESVMNWS